MSVGKGVRCLGLEEELAPKRAGPFPPAWSSPGNSPATPSMTPSLQGGARSKLQLENCYLGQPAHPHPWSTAASTGLQRITATKWNRWSDHYWNKNPPSNAGDSGSIPGLGRCPGEGNGYPFQYSPAWEIPWTEGPGRLQSMGLQRVGHDLATKQPPTLFTYSVVLFLKHIYTTILFHV